MGAKVKVKRGNKSGDGSHAVPNKNKNKKKKVTSEQNTGPTLWYRPAAAAAGIAASF